ncbi:hypothetical protein JTB14_005005 [Gonioctena quinquepunctata]|nr:hypothetical protein JTB14_005005 [Gonioctena quinquepunctata]
MSNRGPMLLVGLIWRTKNETKESADTKTGRRGSAFISETTGHQTTEVKKLGLSRDPAKGQKRAKEGKPKLEGFSTRRLGSDNIAPPGDLWARKKTKTDGLTFTEVTSSVEITVANEGFSREHLETKKLGTIQNSVIRASELLAEQGLQVRFIKCTYMQGNLTITCADNDSAQWLRNTVSTMRSGKEVSLRVMERDQMHARPTSQRKMVERSNLKLYSPDSASEIEASKAALDCVRMLSGGGKSPVDLLNR